MTSNPTCSLWFFAARTDTWYMMDTIPHLVKTSNFPFRERVIAIDTAPLSGEKINRPGVGTIEQLKERVGELITAGFIDRCVEIDYDPDYLRELYRKHFGSPISPTHDQTGAPIFGYLFKGESCQSDYMVHYDTDMMLHQQPGHSWIEEGIRLMESHDRMLFYRPFAGPPTPDGKMLQNLPPRVDPAGFYRADTFGSRVYLVKKPRYEGLLPLSPLWHSSSYKTPLLNNLPPNIKTWLNIVTGRGRLGPWETMVSTKMQETSYFRGISSNPEGWTLHPKDRGPVFRQTWPEIIKKVEAGIYPPEQAGYYDLIPSAWY